MESGDSRSKNKPHSDTDGRKEQSPYNFEEQVQADSQSLDMKPSVSCDSTSPRRKSRCRDEKICRVCSDKALGYNFNAMTCESCKAFFRRNALKKNTPPCLFQGNCKIDLRTRRFCPACRLVKCMDVGMKREMILDDTEKKARMQKVMQNRQKKQTPSQEDPFATLKALVKEEPLSDSEMPEDHQTRPKVIPSLTADTSCMSTILKELSSNCRFLKSSKTFTVDPEPCDSSQLRLLSQDESLLFDDLGNAYSTTLGELIEGRVMTESSYNNCTDLINHSEEAVRRLIKFIKRLEDFQQLSQEDQIAALKACVLSSILFRSASFYNIERDAWKTSTGELSTSLLQKSTGYSEIHEIHTKFCRTVKELIGDRHTMFAIVQAMCIFNPDGKGLISRSLISNIQDRYLILLKHYLESEFSFAEAQARFAHLMMVMSDLKYVDEIHNTILLKANPTEIEPLMLEVLDLKCPNNSLQSNLP